MYNTFVLFTLFQEEESCVVMWHQDKCIQLYQTLYCMSPFVGYCRYCIYYHRRRKVWCRNLVSS